MVLPGIFYRGSRKTSENLGGPGTRRRKPPGGFVGTALSRHLKKGEKMNENHWFHLLTAKRA